MPVLSIQHVIFTRVESAYSPRHTSGYQIVSQSPGLGKHETSQIEKRLQCFAPVRRYDERYQFFWTEQGQAVLTKSVPLPDPDPEVIDRSRRDAFLAHALVLNQEAFASISNDPFVLFDAAYDVFIRDEEQLVNYLQEPAPASRLSVERRKPSDVRYLLDNWQSEALFTLFRLGWQSRELDRLGRSILLQDEDQDELFNLLSLLFMLIPIDKRTTCTFDSCVDGCYPTVGTFWLLGCSRSRSRSGFLPLRLHDRLLEGEGGDDGLLDPKALTCLA